jgi:hypothetical protein
MRFQLLLIFFPICAQIEQLDEGWWSGVSEDGTRSGLFPSNYVQLLDTQVNRNPMLLVWIRLYTIVDLSFLVYPAGTYTTDS